MSVKIGSVLVLIALLSSFVVAVQQPTVQQAGTSNQLVIGAQDAVTASDAGGGYLSTRDLVIIILVILALAALGVLAL
jgi:hypothetical protein